MDLTALFLVIALIFFGIAFFFNNPGRPNFVAGGLFFATLWAVIRFGIVHH